MRREAKGEADAVLMKYEAEAKGVRLVLDSKAAGYSALVQRCNHDARSAVSRIASVLQRRLVRRGRAQASRYAGGFGSSQSTSGRRSVWANQKLP